VRRWQGFADWAQELKLPGQRATGACEDTPLASALASLVAPAVLRSEGAETGAGGAVQSLRQAMRPIIGILLLDPRRMRRCHARNRRRRSGDGICGETLQEA
jgi:hypothetical protein